MIPSHIIYVVDGYWGSDETVAQLRDMLDQHDFFFPGQQALFEFDHSSGHLKKGEDSLTTGKMSVRFGGKQKAPRNTVLTDFCIGSSPAVLWRNPGNKHQWSNVKVDSWEEVDCRLKSGDTLRHTAGPDDPPPHYQVGAPREDTIKTVVDKKTNLSKNVVVEGWVGKAIGKVL